MPTTISKFLHLGMTLEEVVEASTFNPANAIGRAGQIGTLGPGACADIATFKLQEGKFPLIDCYGEGRMATRMLTPTHVVRGGDVIL
jgi:dihydroorotase